MGRRKAKSRKVRPVIFVFCEGETEEHFVNYLRSKYRCPIEIKTKVSTTKILKRGYVSRNTEGRLSKTNDRVFLLYDLDVAGTYQKLTSIKKTELICSNPCFELWLLFHFSDCNASRSSADCIRLLKEHMPNYAKGQKKVFEQYQEDLVNGYAAAKTRAMTTTIPNNPSTDVFKLVDHIRKVSKNEER